jgi:hypothetical protein
MGNEVHLSFAKARGSPGWQQTQNSEYLDLVQHRLEQVSLTWVSQFIGLIEQRAGLKKDFSIKDIGCQAFQFYKQIKEKGLQWRYFGYELEEAYLNIGLKVFPELIDSYCLGDFTTQAHPKITDVSITSATIEHVDNWVLFMERILQSTRDLAIIRTFLGEKTERTLVRALGATQDHPIWQFGFNDLLDIAASLDFSPHIVKDEFTGSIPLYKYYRAMRLGIVRTQYVIVCTRGENVHC